MNTRRVDVQKSAVCGMKIIAQWHDTLWFGCDLRGVYQLLDLNPLNECMNQMIEWKKQKCWSFRPLCWLCKLRQTWWAESRVSQPGNCPLWQTNHCLLPAGESERNGDFDNITDVYSWCRQKCRCYSKNVKIASSPCCYVINWLWEHFYKEIICYFRLQWVQIE